MKRAVYRLFDASGALLYVGVAYEPRWRLMSHRRSEWGHAITDVTITWYADSIEAETAERAAIRQEAPVHNRLRYPHRLVNPRWTP